MALVRLTLDNFTGFDAATLELGAPLTVLTGQGDEKSHALFVLYALYQAGEAARTGAAAVADGSSDPMSLVEAVFEPEDPADLLGAREGDGSKVNLVYETSTGARVEVGYGLDEDGDPTGKLSFLEPGTDRSRAVLLPEDDVLDALSARAEAGRQGFPDDLDRVTLDLCRLLDDGASEGDERSLSPALGAALLAMRTVLGGPVVSRGRDLFVGDRDVRTLPVSLRSLAQLERLLGSRRLAQGDLLLWDRPDPTLAETLRGCWQSLAAGGIQIVLALDDVASARALAVGSAGQVALASVP